VKLKSLCNTEPVAKDVILWHTGSNVISLVFRNFNQKGRNPLKWGKSHPCVWALYWPYSFFYNKISDKCLERLL